MIRAIKMTSKRQATFPAQLCKELRVGPGAELALERKEVDGRPAWVLRSGKEVDAGWFGRLHVYAGGHKHDLVAIRKSIAKKRFGSKA